MSRHGADVARREFIGWIAAGGAVATAGPLVRAQPDGGPAEADRAAGAATPAHFPRQDPALVEEIVRVSHFDLERVSELVEARPELARASWDWGFGDWESALGAASHTGRREIAEVLMAHGARPNVFTFAMLGHVDAVRAAVDARPDIARIRGPHGINLMAHARAGGDAAADVASYLETVPGADEARREAPWDDASAAIYVGAYRSGAAGELKVAKRRGRLSLRPASGASRTLYFLGDHSFYPTGAPSVRIRFDVAGGRAQRVTVHAPDPIIVARRVAG